MVLFKKSKNARDYDFAKDNKNENATFCRPCKLDFNLKKASKHFILKQNMKKLL